MCKECYKRVEQPKENNRRKSRYGSDEEYRSKRKTEALASFHNHKEARHTKHKEWYENNKVGLLLSIHEKISRERHRLIKFLGGKCVRCGITEEEVLIFDHIKPIFNRKRKFNNLKEVKKYPERFQLLCANCHRRKTINDLKKYWEKKRQ